MKGRKELLHPEPAILAEERLAIARCRTALRVKGTALRKLHGYLQTSLKHLLFACEQIPLGHGQIVLQTALVAYLIIQGPDECSLMVSANKDFANFAWNLEQNCRLWETEGSAVACQDLCDNLLDKSGSLCMSVCPVTLPVVWMVYGSPWSRACVMYRWVSGVRHLHPKAAAPPPLSLCVCVCVCV
jgi:hypothetical protein